MLRPARRERGAAAVEFAIVLPLLVVLIAASIDFGRLFYTQNMVVNAAREGARMRVLGYTTAQADARVKDALIGLDTSGSNVTISYSYCGSAGSGSCTAYTSGSPLDCPASPGPGNHQRLSVRFNSFGYLVLGGATRLIGGSGVTAPAPNASADMRCGG